MEPASSSKRKADFGEPSDHKNNDKRSKTKKRWHSHDRNSLHASTIQAGDAGVWATCPKGREGKCVVELRDLFIEYAQLLYPDAMTPDDTTTTTAATMTDEVSIEQEIKAEIDGIRAPHARQLFTSVRLDVQCVIFFKTIDPIKPVALVQKICEDALHRKLRVRTKYVQRLTPMTKMGHASVESLQKIASLVLPSSFDTVPPAPQKYAIRTSMRNHNVLQRNQVIDQVAKLVGPSHTVDLKHYDLLILIEVYKNVCGISVVTREYDTLKRYNLSELMQIQQAPASKDGAK